MRTLFLGIVVLTFTLPSFAKDLSNEIRKRPNILFAMADDWGWPHAGVYGDPVVKTPTFDRIAKEGVLFNHAFVSSPSCTPSRGALLTGQWHWRLEENANLWSTLQAKFQTYPQMLHKAGYDIGHWRKAWGPGRLKPGGRKQDPAGPRFRNFQDFLDRRDAEKPFCFWLGAFDPHRPYKKGSGKAAGMDIDKIQVPGYLPNHETIRNDIADYYFEVQRFDSDVGHALKLLESIGELDHTVVVMTGDHGMPFPRCKSNVYDSGCRVPIAIRWGKNIPTGRKIYDFVNFVDLAPTFLELAGEKIPDAMTGKSFLSLLKSKESGWIDPSRNFTLTGKERHVPSQEKGNTGGYPSRAIRTKDYLYIRNFKPDRWPNGMLDASKAHLGRRLADCDSGPSKNFIVAHRTDPAFAKFYDLAFAKRPAEELFDLKNDPDQLRNVAGVKSYRTVKSRLWKKLENELRKTSDPRVIGGGDRFDTYPYYGGAPKD